MTKAEALTNSLVAGAATIAVILFSFAFASTAYANPSIFANGVTTNSSGTTSPTWIIVGRATSTITYDSLGQTFSGGSTFKTDVAGLLTQFCASSTNAILNTQLEFSQDGVDYFRNFVLDPRQTSATTTQFSVGTPFFTTWRFASSTFAGSTAIGTSTQAQSCSYAAFVIPTPFRFVRVVSSITGANGSVWNQLVPIKERF